MFQLFLSFIHSFFLFFPPSTSGFTFSLLVYSSVLFCYADFPSNKLHMMINVEGVGYHHRYLLKKNRENVLIFGRDQRTNLTFRNHLFARKVDQGDLYSKGGPAIHDDAMLRSTRCRCRQTD